MKIRKIEKKTKQPIQKAPKPAPKPVPKPAQRPIQKPVKKLAPKSKIKPLKKPSKSPDDLLHRLKEKRKARKNRTVKKKSGVFRLVLIVFILLLYIPAIFNWLSGNVIEKEVLRDGSLDKVLRSDGYIVRDESVVMSPFTGKCMASVLEGTRASVDEKIAMVLRDNSAALIKEINSMDIDILKLQIEEGKKNNFFSEDIINVEKEIGQRIKMLVSISNDNGIEKIRTIKDEINTLIQDKIKMISSASKVESRQLKVYREQRANLDKELKKNTGEIATKDSGIISFSVDGYESALKPAELDKITPKLLASIVDRRGNTEVTEFNAETGKPIARVIKDFDYYIVMALKTSEADSMKKGDLLGVKITDVEKEIDGRVDFKSLEIDGKIIVAVKTNKAVSETARLRKINVELVIKPYSGLKIPRKSLKNINETEMTAEIVLVKFNYATTRKVKVVAIDDENAIIASLEVENADTGGISLYDEYVKIPGSIDEGKMIIDES